MFVHLLVTVEDIVVDMVDRVMDMLVNMVETADMVDSVDSTDMENSVDLENMGVDMVDIFLDMVDYVDSLNIVDLQGALMFVLQLLQCLGSRNLIQKKNLLAFSNLAKMPRF